MEDHNGTHDDCRTCDDLLMLRERQEGHYPSMDYDFNYKYPEERRWFDHVRYFCEVIADRIVTQLHRWRWLR